MYYLLGHVTFVPLQHPLVPTRLFSSDTHSSTVAKQQSTTPLPSPGNTSYPPKSPATRTHQQHTIPSSSSFSSSSTTNTAAVTRATHCPTNPHTSPVKHQQNGSSAGQHCLLLSYPKRAPLPQNPGKTHPDETSTTQSPTTTTTCTSLLEAMEHSYRGVLSVAGRVLRVYRRIVSSGSHTQ